MRNDGGIERISVGEEILVNVGLQSVTRTLTPGAIDVLDAVDDGAGNLVLRSTEAVTITGHFADVANAAELINFNGSTYNGFALGAATTPSALPLRRQVSWASIPCWPVRRVRTRSTATPATICCSAAPGPTLCQAAQETT